MDKAPASGAGDSGFKSPAGFMRFFLHFFFHRCSGYMYMYRLAHWLAVPVLTCAQVQVATLLEAYTFTQG